jgi:hypothetical protein
MRKTLALLVASTALTAAVGIPAWSTMQMPSDAGQRAAVLDAGPQAVPLVLASNDGDDDHRRREGTRRGHDGDDRDDDDDEDDDDDDDDRRGDSRNPAPVGTVAPPTNGLFGNGAPPQVQVN